MSTLCPLSEYRLLTGETSSSDAVASSLLLAASTAILSYLDRELEYKNRKLWIQLDGLSDCLDIVLPEWPVRRVRMLSGQSDLAMLRYQGNPYDMPSVQSDTDRIVLMIYSAGEPSETILNYSDYPTWGELSTAILAVTDWTVDVDPKLSGYPSRLIFPTQGEAVQGLMLQMAAPLGNRFKILDKRVIKLDGSLGDMVYVDYDAGYVFPEDDNESSSSSDTNLIVDALAPALPEDIKMVAANVARDMYTVGKTSGGVKFSETITNYSYSIDPGSVQMKDIISRYAQVLSKYANMFVGV